MSNRENDWKCSSDSKVIEATYNWASRRIEAHVKICVLALLIQRITELECGMSWHHIHRQLEQVQITEFFHLNFRVLMRNELTPEISNILKSLNIKPPKQVINLLKKPKRKLYPL